MIRVTLSILGALALLVIAGGCLLTALDPSSGPSKTLLNGVILVVLVGFAVELSWYAVTIVRSRR